MVNFKILKYRIIATALFSIFTIIISVTGLNSSKRNIIVPNEAIAENIIENNAYSAYDKTVTERYADRNIISKKSAEISKNISLNENENNALPLKRYKLKVEESYKHDLSAYTQGLFIYDGIMYESTGQYGSSSFRKVDIKSGKVLKEIQLPSRYFGEGSCVFEGRAYLITWHAQICFVYDIESFTKIAEFNYTGEGWGVTADGNDLIMSNGSSKIYFRDPETFLEKRSITVTLGGSEVRYINELEYIEGKIWANIYGEDRIIIINPQNGRVEGTIDCTGLLESKYKSKNVDVLNGIAYDAKNGSIYLTGKYWPRLYKISLVEK